MSIVISIAASFLKKYWYFVAIALLAILLLKTCDKNTDLRNKNQKSQGQLQSMALDVSRITQEATISKKGFREILDEKKELKWVLDSLKKNPKVITEVHYIRSTKKYRDTVRINTSEYSGMLFNKATYKACGIDVSFGWFNLDTLGDFSVVKHTKIAIVSTNERKRLFGGKRLPKWGKRQYEVTVLTQCGDSLITNYKLTKEK